MGKDFRKRSFSTIDFSSITKSKLMVRGEQGSQGPRGPDGNRGSQGKPGPTGTPAPRAFTFQHLARNSRVGSAKANPSGTELNTPTCDDYPDIVGCPGTKERFPSWNYKCSHFGDGLISRHCNTSSTANTQLTRSFQTMLVTADNPNGGLLDAAFRTTVVLTATATFYTKRSVNRQRLECQLQVARVENGVTHAAQNVGLPITTYRHIDSASSIRQDRLLNISVTGAITLSAGQYDTFLACRAPDDDGNQDNRLEFIEGNLIVLSTRPNGEA